MSKISEVQDWYNHKHRTQGESAWRPQAAYHIFLDYLNVQTATRLLDVACGTGSLLKEASSRGLQSVGIDISELGLHITQSNVPTAQIAHARGEYLPFADESFDYLVCLGALEHFLETQQAIDEFYRVVKPGASLCILVPNINYFLWKLTGRVGTRQQEINENLFSLDEWKALFTSGQFLIESVHEDQWPIGNRQLSLSQPVSFLKRSVFILIWKLMPLTYTYQFIFVLKKPVAPTR